MANPTVRIMGIGPTNSMVNKTESKKASDAKKLGIGPTISIVTRNGDWPDCLDSHYEKDKIARMGIVPTSSMANVGLGPTGSAATTTPSVMAKVVRQLWKRCYDSAINAVVA